MEALFALSRQPLFRLMAAFIVLLLADMRLSYGATGLAAWILWVYVGHVRNTSRRIF
jgi:hypothetical protein